ncbi:hypothetical protein K7X08_006208 [Anisodus acutangulus]|uniref:Uncharacterized protein n=1 Tax=Anisodus acutangulus TaxID=402998 RepID=A0A9Q1MV14_9SOLA|nr:hypothetical protein K7X08_006208 [Anisodus acutangulus]
MIADTILGTNIMQPQAVATNAPDKEQVSTDGTYDLRADTTHVGNGRKHGKDLEIANPSGADLVRQNQLASMRFIGVSEDNQGPEEPFPNPP